jgi:hypothetical protein
VKSLGPVSRFLTGLQWPPRTAFTPIRIQKLMRSAVMLPRRRRQRTERCENAAFGTKRLMRN